MGLRDNLLFMVIGHLVCIGLVALPVLLFYLIGRPYKRGFFCDDESLRHPYHDSTVTSSVLYAYGFTLPIFTIILVETITSRSDVTGILPQFDKPFLTYKVPNLVQSIYHNIWPFLMGAAVQQMVTDIAKYTIGRLRPHFIAVCNPKNLEELCKVPYKYVEVYECESKYSEGHLKEVRLSFPSGHSSFSMFCMLWIVLYLQKRLTCPCVNVQAVKLLLQSGFFYITWYTSMSRISDYKHHWSDVLSGMLIGAAICFAVFYKVAPIANRDLYRMARTSDQDDASENLPLSTTKQPSR
ncbi:putative phosphatidate phosphatase isoform X2 [Galendromus occidentalis]|uniref:Phosphatidate phosphatase isoform X2 n=1 Tax=Galendromus occidentalis TaxID=34638 RepID=A0AAJ6QUU9_9ACAR|nr:putative phosphatidate phosphatase isoform X2 [Galendromus occidentalis]